MFRWEEMLAGSPPSSAARSTVRRSPVWSVSRMASRVGSARARNSLAAWCAGSAGGGARAPARRLSGYPAEACGSAAAHLTGGFAGRSHGRTLAARGVVPLEPQV
jgi:hypothetical protein